MIFFFVFLFFRFFFLQLSYFGLFWVLQCGAKKKRTESVFFVNECVHL